MLLSLVPTAAFAAEPEEEKQVTVTETVDTLDVSLPDNDELLEGFLYQGMNRGISLFGVTAYQRLNPTEQEIYSALLPEIRKIAAGTRSNTELTVGQDVFGPGMSWDTLSGYLSNVTDALLLDCPYEFYWFDKTRADGTPGGWEYSGELSGDYVLAARVKFYVAAAYQSTSVTGDDKYFTTDTGKTSAAAATPAKAQAIVDQYAGRSDYEKLLGYKNEICALVDYNHAAADNDSTPYGDPWQIIYVFDGDKNTNVVCEGYAKAFQYLCDLSAFNDAVCYTVTGTMSGGTGAGSHMWNIVTLEGENYLVDVTNSDSGSVGQNGGLFLSAPDSGSWDDWYSFQVGTSLVKFYYADRMYGENILTLASSDYTPAKTVTNLTATATYSDGTTGSVNAEWKIEGNPWGVTIRNNQLVIDPTASNPGQTADVQVSASYGGKRAFITLHLHKNAAQVASFDISGPDGIAVPTSGSNTAEYSIENICDQYGGMMLLDDATWTWSITGGTGVSVDDTGVVTVTSGAAAGSAILTATCGEVSETFTIHIKDKQDAVVTITGVPTEVVAGSEYFELNAQIQGGSDPDYNKISWSSSNESVLEIQNHGTETVDGNLQAFVGIAVKGLGTATITVTYEDDTYYGQDSVTITVLKKPALSDFTYTLPGDTVYDATAKEATVAVKGGITGMGSYKILYNGSETAPVDAGTYTVTLQVAKSDTYAAATFNLGTFTIAKATPTITASDLTVTKNATQALSASISNGEALTYQSSNPSIAAVDANGAVTGVAEGTAIITIYYSGSENYNSMTKNVTVTVTAKNLVAVTFAAKGDQTYKPEGYALGEQFNTATTTATDGTITYVYNGTTYDDLSDLPTVTDAGVYTVTAVYDSATEHGETQATFTINKADQAALIITSPGPATYGVDYTLTTTGGTGTGEVTFEATGISGETGGRATVSGSTMHPNRAGIVEVIATKAGDNNYNPVTSAPVLITINKADYTGTKDAAGSARYGTTGTVDLSGLIAPDGTATVSAVTDADEILDGAPTMTGNVLSFTFKNSEGNVGKTAEILVTVTSTNYKDYTIPVRVTVVDKYVPILDVKDLFGTYNGQPVPASVITGTATYNGEPVEGTWSWTSGAPINAGTHTVSVTFTPKDTDTYTEATSTIMIYISKATPTGAPKYTAINTSGKTLADAGLTTEGSTFSVPGTVAWNDPTDTEVKANTSYQWTFTPTDTDNYNTVTGSIELWHKSSSSGGSSGSGDKTETEKNPDGSTTTTVTKPNGTVTETTKWPNGSQEVIETKKDGTVTTTTTDKAGNKTEVVENPDGSSKTTVDNKDGTFSVTKVDEDGKVEAQVTLPASVVEDADGQAVTLPMPEVRATSDRDEAPVVTVDLPRNTSAKVEIPVRRATPGTVAVLVKADGTEEIIKTSITTDNGVTVTLSDGDTVKIVDNSKKFADVPASYWGSDYIDFVTSREIFSGTGANTFDPDLPMNRAMIVTVLAAYDGADTSSSGGAWYEAGQRWAMANGISDGTNMEQNLTREQLALMLWSYAGKPDARQSLTGYPDMGSVSSWAKQAMAWAVENGLISGVDGALAPQGEATRAQVATILMRFVEKTV